MSKFTDDPEFTAEMLNMMGKELKQARQRIKDLESFKEAYTANDVLSPDDEDRLRDFRERTDAAEEAMEIMSNHVRNVNKENQRLREQVANLQSCLVKQEDIEPPKREYCNQGVNVRTKEQDDLKTQVEELEGALEKYYSKYVVAKRAKAELEEEIDSLNSANGMLEMKHKDLVAQVDCIQKEKEALLSRNEELETQIGDVKAEINSLQNDSTSMENYRSLLPAVNNIGKQVASTPPTSQPVCFLGVDLSVYLQTDPRTARYSRNCLFSPDLLQFPDGSGRSALWLRPLFEFDGRSLSCTTRPPLGRVFTVFYPMNGRVLYAGQYTVSHVFPRNPKGAGYLISNKDPQDAKAIEVINTLVSSNGDPNGARILDHQKFYTGPVLQVGVVDLKFLSFDHQFHDILGQRFQASLPVERRNKFPNSSAVKSSSVRNQSGASNDDNLSRVKRRRM